MNLSNAKILVTGGRGFLGSHVREEFLDRCKDLICINSRTCDLTNPHLTESLITHHKPDVIIHLAAKVGGIGANQKYPGTYFYDNMMMGLNIIHSAMLLKVPKIVVIGTICAYPNNTPVPFKESDLWNGYPEATNAPYGIAKKALLVQCQAYREEFGLNAIYLLPVNLYGPRDNFDPGSSHVIPALIRKIVHAKDTEAGSVEIWGTGVPTREFLYASDAALGIRLATESYDEPGPVNLGTGTEISINDLAYKIKDIIGWNGSFEFNTSKPDGQPRRCLDTTLAKEKFGFEAKVNFDVGLKDTIDWWLVSKNNIGRSRGKDR